MLDDFRENVICHSVVKFVDIVLDLYSPVPYQIRNEMRILQSTLLYGHIKELQDYIQNLKQKLQLKQKFRLSHHTHSQKSLLQKSPIKIAKNILCDSEKENKFYLNNRVNTSENSEKDQSFMNKTFNQMPKTRKISAIEYINKQEDHIFEQKKNSAREPTEIGRNSSRTLLKIIKKSKSSKQKMPLFQRSIQSDPIKHSGIFKTNTEQMLKIMDKGSKQLQLLLRQGQKNHVCIY